MSLQARSLFEATGLKPPTASTAGRQLRMVPPTVVIKFRTAPLQVLLIISLITSAGRLVASSTSTIYTYARRFLNATITTFRTRRPARLCPAAIADSTGMRTAQCMNVIANELYLSVAALLTSKVVILGSPMELYRGHGQLRLSEPCQHCSRGVFGESYRQRRRPRAGLITAAVQRHRDMQSWPSLSRLTEQRHHLAQHGLLL